MVSRASTSELLPVQCPLSQEGTALGISRDGRKPRPLRPCNNRRNPIHLSTRTITAQRTSCSRTHPPRRRQYAHMRNHCHSPYTCRAFSYTATSVPHGQGDRHTRTARTGASATSMSSDFGDILPQNSRSTRPAPRPCGGRMRGDARIAPTRCVFDRWEHSRRFPDAFSRFGSVPAARPGAFLRFGSIFGLGAALRQTAIVLAVISRVSMTESTSSMSEWRWLYWQRSFRLPVES